MLKRVLSAALCAFVFGILAPVLYLLLVGVPGSMMAAIWITLIGLVTGTILGALFLSSSDLLSRFSWISEIPS